jgi:hypothetical protein
VKGMEGMCSVPASSDMYKTAYPLQSLAHIMSAFSSRGKASETLYSAGCGEANQFPFHKATCAHCAATMESLVQRHRPCRCPWGAMMTDGAPCYPHMLLHPPANHARKRGSGMVPNVIIISQAAHSVAEMHLQFNALRLAVRVGGCHVFRLTSQHAHTVEEKPKPLPSSGLCSYDHVLKPFRLRPRLVDASVQVHISVLDGQALRKGDFLVIEDAPVATLHDVCNVVATGGVCPDVAHNRDKLVFSGSVQHLLRSIALGYCHTIWSCEHSSALLKEQIMHILCVGQGQIDGHASNAAGTWLQHATCSSY